MNKMNLEQFNGWDTNPLEFAVNTIMLPSGLVLRKSIFVNDETLEHYDSLGHVPEIYEEYINSEIGRKENMKFAKKILKEKAHEN